MVDAVLFAADHPRATIVLMSVQAVASPWPRQHEWADTSFLLLSDYLSSAPETETLPICSVGCDFGASARPSPCPPWIVLLERCLTRVGSSVRSSTLVDVRGHKTVLIAPKHCSVSLKKAASAVFACKTSVNLLKATLLCFC